MSEKHELFVEVGSEEIPAGEVDGAVASLAAGIIQRLSDLRLSHGEPKTYATPRRLAVVVPAVDALQEDLVKEALGPPVRVAYKDGAPTKAAEGFAKGLGLTVADLYEKKTDKGEYLAAKVEEKGKPALELLPDVILESIKAIPFKRTMRWGNESAAFVRPIQWICAVFGKERVKLVYADVESSVQSRGHRFMSPESFVVESGEAYAKELEKRKVMASVADRKARIVREAAELAKSVSGRIRDDEDLIDEVVQLVEWPVLMLGEFDSRFLEIPSEVLISEMREHQRYLSIVDADGKLLPQFVVVGNTEVSDKKKVMEGYLRVLSARFEDGAFFFKEDQKVPPAERIERLEKMQFHRALGSILDKVDRVAKLAFWLGERLLPGKIETPADIRALATGPASSELSYLLARAGYLMKTDLTTSMVFEFPELQGVIGREYARKAGEPEDVALAIEEHYLPKHASDRVPSKDLGALLGIADRLDTIAGIFSVGKGPTGAADPFGLRRAALGIIHILRDRGWHLSLFDAIDSAVDALEDKRKKKSREEVIEAVRDFFRGRLKGLLQSTDEIPTDVVEAALTAGYEDVVDAGSRAKALMDLRKGAEFEPVAACFKRVGNILFPKNSKEELEKKTLDPSLFKEGAEKALLEAAEAAKATVDAAVSERDFAKAFSAIVPLRPKADQFFDDVMVNVEGDPKTTNNRLALLYTVHQIFAPLADFSRLS